MMILDTKYKFGDSVYLITDTEQLKRLVTGFNVRITGIVYLLSCGAVDSCHYDFEITENINVIMTTTN